MPYSILVFSWDGKATTPEEMVSLHFKDPVKMQADTLDVLIDVLAQDKELMDLFCTNLSGNRR